MFPKMAYQIPRFKSKRLVSQLKLPRNCLQTLMVGLCIVALSICSVQTAICSASVSTSAATTTEQSTLDLHFGGLKCKFILSSI